MENKLKFIAIGLLGFVLILIFLFTQALTSKQQVIKERDELKSENASLSSKVEKFGAELRDKKKENDALKGELDKNKRDIEELMSRYNDAVRARDELTEKLKNQPQAAPQEKPQYAPPQQADAYWADVLKAKTDLEMQIDNIRMELKTIQINNEQLEREKAALGLDIDSLRRENADLKRQIEYNQKIMDSIAQELVREKSDKMKIQEGFQPLKNENDALSRQLKGLYAKKTGLDRKITDLQQDKSVLGKKVTDMETMLTDKISQINTLKEQLENIRGGPNDAGNAAISGPEKKDTVELPPIVVRPQEGAVNAAPVAGGAPVAASGSVLTVNKDSNFVIIDLGEDNGVKVGNSFKVYRGMDNIASIEVIKVSRSVAACDIKQEVKPIKIGDKIST